MRCFTNADLKNESSNLFFRGEKGMNDLKNAVTYTFECCDDLDIIDIISMLEKEEWGKYIAKQLEEQFELNRF